MLAYLNYTDRMTTTLKYNLSQMNAISSGTFRFEIPEETYNMINYLCAQVGSCSLTSNVYEKSEIKGADEVDKFKQNKKRKGNKAMEISSEEWESIRTFQATKIEQKSGIESDIDQIRLYLNKLTDKNFLDMRDNIIARIDKICSETENSSDINKVGSILYDLCSTNKFYSKVYADLFAELATKYSWLKCLFDERQENIMEEFKNIKYVDSDKDYDGFCDMNKKNERRKALTTFMFNLSVNNFIQKQDTVKLLRDLLSMIDNFVMIADKKNEVDELTENVAILFNKEIIEEVVDDADDEEEYYVNYNNSIIDLVNKLAKSKAKDYPSLSNKAIFKYMDLVEM